MQFRVADAAEQKEQQKEAGTAHFFRQSGQRLAAPQRQTLQKLSRQCIPLSGQFIQHGETDILHGGRQGGDESVKPVFSGGAGPQQWDQCPGQLLDAAQTVKDPARQHGDQRYEPQQKKGRGADDTGDAAPLKPCHGPLEAPGQKESQRKRKNRGAQSRDQHRRRGAYTQQQLSAGKAHGQDSFLSERPNATENEGYNPSFLSVVPIEKGK